MTQDQFIQWLRSYIKSLDESEAIIPIATMLSLTNDKIDTNPYWSSVNTTGPYDNSNLNYNVKVDPKTNTYTTSNLE